MGRPSKSVASRAEGRMPGSAGPTACTWNCRWSGVSGASAWAARKGKGQLFLKMLATSPHQQALPDTAAAPPPCSPISKSTFTFKTVGLLCKCGFQVPSQALPMQSTTLFPKPLPCRIPEETPGRHSVLPSLHGLLERPRAE